MERASCDVLIIGGGGAALYAAIHCHDANPRLDIMLACKGLVGKSGCTRMVQGGYNVVLHPEDSFDQHYDDTLRGGSLINDQELAWTLVTEAPKRIFELENRYGCFFDRNADGTIHQRPLAGQSFNRTIHRGDLTGIELISRLTEQAFARRLRVVNDLRGVDLLLDQGGRRVAGAILFDYHSGALVRVQAKAVLLATGGAAPLYRITAASIEKTGDGLAMAWRAGAELIDMEMMQFHPTGLIAGGGAITGTVLEEGLRGAGGHLLNAAGERFMERYDPARMERSTRDRVSRSEFMELRAGRGTSEGGVFLDVRHLGKDFLLRSSPGMYRRCLSVGYDMATDPVMVTPTAHFQMGGIRIDRDCRSSLLGLFAAGEDAGGVHGANRLGGNGVAESMVFGARAGDAIAAYLKDAGGATPDRDRAENSAARFTAAKGRAAPGRAYELRAEIGDLAWQNLGLIRSAAGLDQAAGRLAEIEAALAETPVPASAARDPAFAERLNVENLIAVARLIRAAAHERDESRGSHFREDRPETDAGAYYNLVQRRDPSGTTSIQRQAVAFTRRRPEDLAGDTVIAKAAPRPALHATEI
ncbi:MAG: FAD-binding protein [Alphaproteobacteria bacterium]|nr:FAD-binding protein [Alphaproteobacteria bacterium]